MGITVLIVGINFLKGVNLFEKQNSYFGVYENVDGLAISNPVVLNGYKVGQVSKIKFVSQGNGALLVAFTINENDLAIPSDSKARIISSDFFGSKAIELVFGESPVAANPGDTLTSEIEIGLAEAVRRQINLLRVLTIFSPTSMPYSTLTPRKVCLWHLKAFRVQWKHWNKLRLA